ncbi:MAG: sterol desaturase family protein [Cytophagaceae bacterium]|nr:sterol desaturase family protein [Cytophagaceae bacterium]MDW8456078.1 sterol desaturase family protein [Cytophagaceae bacterium]
MYYLINVSLFITSFILMEFAAWFAHKYIMHGFLWWLHEDHHSGKYHIFQKNDSFALFFAIPSWLCIMLGLMWGNDGSVWFGAGIAAYGVTYFFVHEVIIHQRIKWFRNIKHPYFLALRRAHKVHHKKLTKEGCECFGMLIVPMKYFRESFKKA